MNYLLAIYNYVVLRLSIHPHTYNLGVVNVAPPTNLRKMFASVKESFFGCLRGKKNGIFSQWYPVIKAQEKAGEHTKPTSKNVKRTRFETMAIKMVGFRPNAGTKNLQNGRFIS